MHHAGPLDLDDDDGLHGRLLRVRRQYLRRTIWLMTTPATIMTPTNMSR